MPPVCRRHDAFLDTIVKLVAAVREPWSLAVGGVDAILG
jgi:hypothetical protein